MGISADGGAHTTATTAFAATYLDTDIGHQLVSQMAAARHVVVTPADLATARLQFQDQISAILQDVTGSQYACGSSTTTGQQVLATLPKSFVNANVRFDATVSILEEKLAGVGASTADLERYFNAHRAMFATDAFTVASYTSRSDAQAAAAKVAAGTPFSTVASAEAGGGPQGNDILYGIATQLPASAKLESLPVNTLSAPISYNGAYLLVEITKSSPTPYASAAAEVKQAVQSAGAAKTRAALQALEKHASISLDPRYGTWAQSDARISLPASPVADDVLNGTANLPAAATPASPLSGGSAAPSTGQSG